MNAMIPSRLSDGELIDEVGRLAQCERDDTVSLIAHLAELYRRRLHERAGYSSLFTYCVGVLRLSEAAAYDRMRAAKVVRRYPEVLGLLAVGSVNLTTVRLVAPYLTRENHQELVAAAAGKGKRAVQELLARRYPKADAASSVRKLPARRVENAPAAISFGAAATPGDSGPSRAGGSVPLTADVRPVIPPSSPPLVQPLSPDRYRIAFTASAALREKLEFAQDLLRHAVPSGEPAQIVERALDVLLEELVARKYAMTNHPRTSGKGSEDPACIPAGVRRAVYIRDRGRCPFVGTQGHRCRERAFLEFHHVLPRAAGGRATVENIALRCRAHNGCEVDLFCGPHQRYGVDSVNERAAPYGCVGDDTFSFRHERRRYCRDAGSQPRV